MDRTLTTVQAAQVVSAQLGITPALSERFVNTQLRAWPADALPPVRGGKRRWSEAHVERLRGELEERGMAVKTA